MRNTLTYLSRFFAVFLSLALVGMTVPAAAIPNLAEGSKAFKPKPKPAKKTRLLTAKKMRQLQGKAGENPYLAGQNKWDVVYHGVNLMTGNFMTSATDLTFEGGYGIPVNVSRSYSANDADQGPLGKGWSLSVDIRSTVGGLLKSGPAPVRSVPVAFKERPATQNDPHVADANEPVEAVIATDSGGLEETIQKDVDGILTTPSWDKNRCVSEYEDVVVGPTLYQVMTKNTCTTPEGTVYVYEKQGNYPSGSYAWDDPNQVASPANVLKITTVTDRQGNLTTYTYGAGTVSFNKINGTTSEHPLTSIAMPNGHTITFTWTGNRITSASDGVRTVLYGYTSGLLTSVTTPGGKVTTYGYGSATLPQYQTYTGSIATDLLTSVTDSRGMTTTIYYNMKNRSLMPYWVPVSGAAVQKIAYPNGTFSYFGGHPQEEGLVYDGGPGGRYAYTDRAGGPTGTILNNGLVQGNTFQGVPQIMVSAWSVQPDSGHGNSSETWAKTYDITNQNLIKQEIGNRGKRIMLDGVGNRFTGRGDLNCTFVDTVYNFMGNPLKQTTKDYSYDEALNETIDTSVVEYSYWGKDKYYQRKATKDQGGRYSYNDYYPSNATQGKRGQVYRAYDGKRTTFVLDSNIPVPNGTPSANYWKYRLVPQDPNTYSAQFDYDSKGRGTDVWKIKNATTSPWIYVQTHTNYAADGTPAWGGVSSVIEDNGSGKLNRTTTTLAYDSAGRAIKVRDAANKELLTNYDADGVIQSIYRVDGGLNQPVLTYAYGASGLTNGMITGITDNLSGISQAFTYQSTAGGGYGQLASVTETNGSSSYSTSYTYNAGGQRETSTYATPNGTTRWGYYDFQTVGDLLSPMRAFQTMTKLDSSGNPTSEEFHYQYSSAGRLFGATFAQSPDPSFTPTTGNHWYDASHPASHRARAFYTYDAQGRMTNVENYWEDYSGSYTPTPILGNHCDYEQTGLDRGFKTQSKFYAKNPSSSAWLLERTETFGYDADLDYLTSANYGDGQPNASVTWSYDGAGNRTGDSTVPGIWTYDNLNRITVAPFASYTNDILGNRLTKGANTYTWDILNRMTGMNSATYQYRADGMRAKKTVGSTVSTYCYDAQMPVETTEDNGTTVTVTRNAIGGRSVDWIQRVSGSTTVTGYPIFDAAGNNIATLTKSGTTFTIGDRRAYDAWGNIRQGATTGDPKNRFDATSGHVQDDESGLVYMRARYYDSTLGRFISEDPAHSGANWFVYAGCNPVALKDNSGRGEVPGWVGPAGNALWLLNTLNSVVALCNSCAALHKFLGDLSKAQDSLDVENAFGTFMKGFNKSITSMIDSSGYLGNAMAGAETGLHILDGIGKSSTMLSVIQTLVTGILLGAQYAIIGIAYNLRIAWYIDDIDNF